MKNVILEYAGAVLAVLGAISFLVIIGRLFMGPKGMLAALVLTVLGGL